MNNKFNTNKKTKILPNKKKGFHNRNKKYHKGFSNNKTSKTEVDDIEIKINSLFDKAISQIDNNFSDNKMHATKRNLHLNKKQEIPDLISDAGKNEVLQLKKQKKKIIFELQELKKINCKKIEYIIAEINSLKIS
jgi:hypothetical protein